MAERDGIDDDKGFRMAEWLDVEPLTDDSGPDVAVNILYDEEYAKLMSYMRACIEAGEKSKRVLDLTRHVLIKAQAFFTVWDYRWQVLEALQLHVEGDWELTQTILAKNPKNYQLWNHRRRLATAAAEQAGKHEEGLVESGEEALPVAAQMELEFTATALDGDSKNYHAWAHRQSVVALYHLWETEVRYALTMLGRDIRNNSAWNQLFWVLDQVLSGGQGSCQSRVATDAWEAVCRAIAKAPHNASAWNFLMGMLRRLDAADAQQARCVVGHWLSEQGPEGVAPTMAAGRSMLCHEVVFQLCTRALAEDAHCPPALSMLAAHYSALAQAAAAVCQHGQAEKAAQQAQALYAALSIMDPIRQPYWSVQVQDLKQEWMQPHEPAG